MDTQEKINQIVSLIVPNIYSTDSFPALVPKEINHKLLELFGGSTDGFHKFVFENSNSFKFFGIYNEYFDVSENNVISGNIFYMGERIFFKANDKNEYASLGWSGSEFA